MQAEYQSPESRVAAIEDSYSYAEAVSIPVSRSHRANRIPSELFRYRVIKRCADVLLVLISMPLTLLTLGIVSVMVMLSSPGPILYSHRRIRKSGAFFSMWKFRTMCVNSAEVLEEYLAQNPKARTEWNETHKLRNDPRITPIGLFLRRYSLDELPQLWNVLVGQMSLVGPRPIVAAEVEKYGDSFRCYCRVKPGLTGLWQVSGRSELTYDERVALDCEYVQRWSLWNDLKILSKTFSSVINQDGAF
ncbi:MAG TPA: sugar transferase [Edaphobacter sp.]|jgi:Undecaprenyl-phosphate galactose phosphotransferase WbaP|nr:sugar transferase [Edaphobacter sp.]